MCIQLIFSIIYLHKDQIITGIKKMAVVSFHESFVFQKKKKKNIPSMDKNRKKIQKIDDKLTFYDDYIYPGDIVMSLNDALTVVVCFSGNSISLII